MLFFLVVPLKFKFGAIIANSDTYFPCFFVYVLRVCPKTGVNTDIVFMG